MVSNRLPIARSFFFFLFGSAVFFFPFPLRSLTFFHSLCLPFPSACGHEIFPHHNIHKCCLCGASLQVNLSTLRPILLPFLPFETTRTVQLCLCLLSLLNFDLLLSKVGLVVISVRDRIERGQPLGFPFLPFLTLPDRSVCRLLPRGDRAPCANACSSESASPHV